MLMIFFYWQCEANSGNNKKIIFVLIKNIEKLWNELFQYRLSSELRDRPSDAWRQKFFHCDCQWWKSFQMKTSKKEYEIAQRHCTLIQMSNQ